MHLVYSILSRSFSFYSINQALKIEVMKNRPADLEDFVVAFCEARLQGRALPETTVGQNMGGDGVKLERRAIIRVMKKETITTDPLSRRGSLESVSFAGGSKRGSFGGTPLLDFSLQKKGSFSNSNITLKLSSDTYSGRRDSAMPIRTDSNLSTASSEDSSIDN